MIRPVEVALGCDRAQNEQSGRRHAVLRRRYHVPLAFRHLGAVVEHHPVGEQLSNRLPGVDEPDIRQCAREKAKIEQMHHRVLVTADVLIDGQPLAGSLGVERLVALVGRDEPEVVPRRIDERIQRIRLSPRVAVTLGTGRLDELIVGRQRRPGLGGKLRQFDRKLLVGDEHLAAVLAVDDRDRRPPVSLSGDTPVPDSVVGVLRCGVKIGEQLLTGLRCRDPGVLAALDQLALTRVRNLCAVFLWFDNDPMLDIVCCCERVVFFIVCWRAHHRTRA